MEVKLQIIVEGQIEQIFVEQILTPHLHSLGIICFCHVIPTKVNEKTYRGGGRSYTLIDRDISRTLGYQSHYVTTMFDLYALPHDTPGKEGLSPDDSGSRKVQVIETALERKIDNIRFIPYIQLHEFEALLFSHIEKIDEVMTLREDSHIDTLQRILHEAREPENINDNPNTAPSKRLLSLYPSYKKTLDGAQIFNRIPLSRIRAQCPHFDTWITRLEQLAPQNGDSL